MSAILGPIHHWLNRKIDLQEALTDRLTCLAGERDWSLPPDLASPPGDLDVPLEDKIDLGNIHGWLQDRIHRAEGRYGETVTSLLSADPDRLTALEEAARQFGAEHPATGLDTPQAVYQFYENTFLNGMPCDRVNLVTGKDDRSLTWRQTRDLHGAYWAGGEPAVYDRLRSAVLAGMLSATGWQVVKGDGMEYTVLPAGE